jgi:hypothetical protein
MALKAAAHSGQLIAGCELNVLNFPVTLRAADISAGVKSMAEAQLGTRHHRAPDTVTVARNVTRVAKTTLADQRVRVFDVIQVTVIRPVATVAALRLR